MKTRSRDGGKAVKFLRMFGYPETYEILWFLKRNKTATYEDLETLLVAGDSTVKTIAKKLLTVGVLKKQKFPLPVRLSVAPDLKERLELVKGFLCGTDTNTN